MPPIENIKYLGNIKIRTAIAYGVLLLIFLIPFQLYFSIYQNLSLSAAQILAGILFCATLISKRRELINHLKNSRLDQAILVFLAVMAASVLVSSDILQSIKYCVKWSSFVLIYFIARANVYDDWLVGKSFDVLFWTTVAISALGIYEFSLGFPGAFEWIVNNPLARIIIEPDTLDYKMKHATLNWFINTPNGIKVRAFGTFEGSIEYSAYLGIAVAFFPHLFMKVSKMRKIIIVAFMGVIIASLVLTFTRSAYLSLIVMSGLYWVVMHKEMNSNRFLKYGTYCVVILVIMGSVAFLIKPARQVITARFNRPVHEQFDRGILWERGVKLFVSNPLLGVGLANYENALRKYYSNIEEKEVLPSHNQYIQMAAETGILGLLAYLTIVLCSIKNAYEVFAGSSKREMKLMALGFLGMMTWYCVQSNFNNYLFGDKYSMIFWLMLGLNAALYNVYHEESRKVSGA